MSAKRSRVEIAYGKRKEITLFIFCETTKQIIPCYGLEHSGAVMLAQILRDMAKAGMSLPEELVDRTKGEKASHE